ncbi:ABC transporter substrate-binding protein [Actinobacillus minor]|uniref:ABC transporter substrate-binding protein n=1 Tax=Actinobacillus minor TaxID=51047 RepID=UPI0023F03151|nr:ABC transporter substrate-binding protein [Actinobacillus minor]MDD6910965.1 helical backbone metal receptor [Actinobacillus minor]MDY4712563.1 helical backbone metal receptor [Actinobacillus minor]
MKKTLTFFTALFLPFTTALAQEQFVSLTLCSDRLLAEIARPEQIAAMSPYSKNPLMMLDKVNQNKPTLEPQLSQLLPYLDKTMLINELFYPQLVAELKQLGVKILPINDSPQTPEQLFELILQLGKLTDNQAKAEQLVTQLKSQNVKLNQPLTDTLILSDTGVVDTQQPNYQALLQLLGLTPLKTALTPQNFSLEKVVLSQPNILISLTDEQGYNEQAELLSHPLLQNYFQNRPRFTLPMKYTYCFDHGIWKGAELIYKQLR